MILQNGCNLNWLQPFLNTFLWPVLEALATALEGNFSNSPLADSAAVGLFVRAVVLALVLVLVLVLILVLVLVTIFHGRCLRFFHLRTFVREASMRRRRKIMLRRHFCEKRRKTVFWLDFVSKS